MARFDPRSREHRQDPPEVIYQRICEYEGRDYHAHGVKGWLAGWLASSAPMIAAWTHRPGGIALDTLDAAAQRHGVRLEWLRRGEGHPTGRIYEVERFDVEITERELQVILAMRDKHELETLVTETRDLPAGVLAGLVTTVRNFREMMGETGENGPLKKT